MQTPHQDDYRTPQPELASFDFQQLISTLLEHVVFLICCTLVGTLGAVAYIKRLPYYYQSTAVLQVEEQKQIVNFDSEQSSNIGSESAFQTLIEQLRSHSILEKTGMVLKLKDIAPPLEIAPNALGSYFQAKQRKGSQLVDIVALHQNPVSACRIANAVAEAYLQEYTEQRAEGMRSAMQFLLKEADQLKARLQKSEESLQNYIEANHAASLEEKQDTVTAALKSQASNVASARSNRIRLETDVADMARFKNQPDQLLSIASIAQHPSVVTAKSLINELLSRISTLRLRYTEKHPKLILAQQQLKDAQTSLHKAVLEISDTLKAELSRAKATEQSFTAALKEQEQQSFQLNRQSISYNVLLRDVETDRSLYQAVLKRLKETDVARGIQLNSVRLFESASVSEAPIAHKNFAFLISGLLLGLITGAAGILGSQLFKKTYRSVEEIEDASGLPILSSIPNQRILRSKRSIASFMRDSRSPLFESFRSLRTSLHIHARQSGKRSFLFTSALSGDGKSLCSVGYAISLAHQGARTLLIDADVRQPFLAKNLLGTDQLPGLLDLLQGTETLESATFPTETGGLDLMPAGRLVANASELLTKTGLVAILNSAREHYECVVIDCAPVLPVSDAVLLSPAVDAVCVVVRYGVTPQKSVLRTVHTLREANAPLEGIIFNGVNSRMLPRYYEHASLSPASVQ